MPRARSGGFDEVGSESVEDVFQGFAELEFFLGPGIGAVYAGIGIAEERDFGVQEVEVEEFGFAGVVEVSDVVSNFINPINKLRFEGRTKVEQVFGELRKRRGGVVTGMLDNAFANFKGEIQAGKVEIAVFELLDDAQCVEIVIEGGAVGAHELVEFAFPGVAKGRMADVVDESKGFGELAVEAKRGRDGAGDLCDFEGVGKAIAEVIGIARGEDLRFGFQASKGARVNDAIAVARVLAAIRVAGFGISAAARDFFAHGQRREWSRIRDHPLRICGERLKRQDFGASKSRPRSARSAMAVFVG